MSFRPDHHLHRRRYPRNLGLALCLGAFVLIVMGLTVVKVSRGGMMQAFDHVVRPELAREVGQ